MAVLLKAKNELDKKFQRVVKTPASYDFFVAIHDFVEIIEQNASLSANLSYRIKPNRELKIPTKYTYLKQIYQGLEDAASTSKNDIGHARYAVLRELTRIKNNDLTDSNSFWKKRELIRKLTGEIYERLTPHVAA